MQTRAIDIPHGPAIVVRPLRNGDVATVAAVFSRLGDESRRRRFNAAKPCLSDAELAQLATVDARCHALVAHVVGDPEPAGLAQLVRTDGRSAEIAFVVADRYQQRGIGSTLTRLLLDDARAAGITEITALATGDNRAALALIRRVASHQRDPARRPRAVDSRRHRLDGGRFRHMSGLDVRSLLDGAGGGDLDLWARTINPQFVRVLRTIGFDRPWARAEGAYLYDTDGARYLDMLGGFGMYNVGRNNRARPRCARRRARARHAGDARDGRHGAPGTARRRSCSRARRRGSSAACSRAAAPKRSRRRSSSAAPRRSARASSRPTTRFHGLTLGSLSANGNPEFTDRFGPLLPGFERVPFGELERARARAEARGRRGLHRRADSGQGRALAAARLPRRRAGALPPLRHALLRRRGADRLRPHREDVRVRALGARAGSRPRREVALRRLRPGRRAAHVARGARGRLRLDGARGLARLDVRAERARDGRRPRDAEGDRRRAARRALRPPRREAPGAHGAVRRRARRRPRGARPRSHVGDRVRRGTA